MFIVTLLTGLLVALVRLALTVVLVTGLLVAGLVWLLWMVRPDWYHNYLVPLVEDAVVWWVRNRRR